MKQEDKVWQFIVLCAIAITIVSVGLITQHIFHSLFENHFYDMRMVKQANEAYNLRFEPQKVITYDLVEKSRLNAIFEACRAYELPTTDCLTDVLAIGWVESGLGQNTNHKPNTNGTTDCGNFGINSIHNFNSCGNWNEEVKWVVSKLVDNGYKENRDRAVMRYHSKTAFYQKRYFAKIQIARELF